MKVLCSCLAAMLLMHLSLAQPAKTNSEANQSTRTLQGHIFDIYKQHKNAVVTVYAAHQSKTGKNALLVGTGFYVSREGHILTNAITVQGAGRIWIEHNGIAYSAKRIGADPISNVAVLKTALVPSNFKYLRFSEAVKPPPIGTLIVALSSELGMQPGPSFGLINGWNTEYGKHILPTLHLRGDIAYDGGEGGAPVFDMKGTLIGMTTIALPETRSSFILPARAIKRIRDDILFSGKATFAYLGIQAKEVADPRKKSRVLVESVDPNSPAEKAGIRTGDILLRAGNSPINTDADLRIAIFYMRPKALTELQVRRGERILKFPVKPDIRSNKTAEFPLFQKPKAKAALVNPELKNPKSKPTAIPIQPKK